MFYRAKHKVRRWSRAGRAAAAASATLAMVGAVVGLAAPVSADTPNPVNITKKTITPNGDGTTTVTVEGTWSWAHGKDCNKDRYGTGWNASWNDPTDPGQLLKKFKNSSVF